MKKVCLIDKTVFDVSGFDVITNKEYPYYQDGRKYALCPNCKSSVQIMGGKNNRSQSKKTLSAYAAHTQNERPGLPFDENYKTCDLYEGNKGNWRRIYEKTAAEKNEELERYILNNKDEVARELSNLTGIRFYNEWDETPTTLFEKLCNSFEKHKGLYRRSFIPDAVPRLLLATGEPVKFWGYIIFDEEIKKEINSSTQLRNCLNKDQFKAPDGFGDVNLVAALDDIDRPKCLVLKLRWGHNRDLIIKRISANYWSD